MSHPSVNFNQRNWAPIRTLLSAEPEPRSLSLDGVQTMVIETISNHVQATPPFNSSKFSDTDRLNLEDEEGQVVGARLS